MGVNTVYYLLHHALQCFDSEKCLSYLRIWEYLSNHSNTPTNYNINVPLHWVLFLPMWQWISLFYLRGSFWIFPISQHSIDLLSGRIHLTWYIIHRSERQQLIASSYLILVQFIMQLHFLLFHSSSIDKLQQLIQSWAINSHCLS